MRQGERNPLCIAATIFGAICTVLILFKLDTLNSAPPLILQTEDTVSYRDVHDKFVLEYAIWSMQENVEVFDWTLRSTKYIFWISMLITLSGIALAFWQFAKAGEFERECQKADKFEIKTEMASFSFRSKSIASLMLCMSMIYTFVYVKYLYPIEVVPVYSQNIERPSPTTIGAELEPKFEDPVSSLSATGDKNPISES